MAPTASTPPQAPRKGSTPSAEGSTNQLRRYSQNEDIEIIKPQEVTSIIPPMWRRKMMTWFQRWDANGDGKLTIEDFAKLAENLAKYCPTGNSKRFKEIFDYLWEHFICPAHAETAHFGAVTQQEWIDNHYKARIEWDKNPTIGASLIATFGLLFDAIDTDSDSFISMDEYKTFYMVLGINELLADDPFHAMDTNKDGKVSREEFLDTVMAYYCELEPSDEELRQSLFLGPLVENPDINQDLMLNYSGNQ